MFSPLMPLHEAQSVLRTLVDEGAQCPCCTQYAKVYRRKLNSGMARSLIVMYRAAGLGWQHIPTTVGGRSREEGKLRYWGLVEEATEPRDDGGRSGFWRVTAQGERFVRGEAPIPKYARVYDGRCLGLHGELVTIRDALGAKFDYDELMGTPPVPTKAEVAALTLAAPPKPPAKGQDVLDFLGPAV